MKNIFIAVLFFLGVSSSFAETYPVCTKEPREAWLKTEQVKKKVEDMGLKLRKFTTMEYCFFVEALDKAGKKVEVYFDPATGEPVKPTQVEVAKEKK